MIPAASEPPKLAIWSRWTLANTAGWIVFGLPAILAGGVYSVVNEFGPGAENLFGAAGWPLAWLLGGALLALVQATALRGRIALMRWIGASSIGWLMAWLVAVVSGRTVWGVLAVGFLTGAAQWLVLRRLPGAAIWPAATLLAWLAFGLLDEALTRLSFLPAASMVSGFMILALGGTLYGAITGLALARLLAGAPTPD